MLYERFGLFVTSLHHFQDEGPEGAMFKTLREERKPAGDPRWDWSSFRAQHYAECPVYAPLTHDWSKVPVQTNPHPKTGHASSTTKFDVFISHASEDKASFVKGLADQLTKLGLTVWYDAATLTLGDSLSKKINEGLKLSSYGVVVLSHSFFAKEWPQAELAALFAQEMSEGKKRILPVRHGVTQQDVLKYSPLLADKLATLTEKGVQAVAQEIFNVVHPSPRNATIIVPSNHEPSPKILSQQEQQYYSQMVKQITNRLMLKKWLPMLHWMTITPPQWEVQLLDNIDGVRDDVSRAVWPKKLLTLEASIKAVARSFANVSAIFYQHSEIEGDKRHGIPFYKAIRNNPNYDRDLERFNEWMKRYDAAFRELVKSLNWFSDVVREHIEPSFLVKQGYFIPQNEEDPIKYSQKEITEMISKMNGSA
ncbi:MAG: toll/interleukin-1 receptor domain-containing protein [Limisphaerales bacterium]